MCTNCFDILNQFNANKICWIENQDKIMNQDENLEEKFEQEENLVEEEIIVEEEVLDEESQTLKQDFEMIEDAASGEYEYPVEYIDEMAFNETEIATDDSLADKRDEEPEIPLETKKPRKRKKKIVTKVKGKDIYQKLLKKCSTCSKMVEKNRMDGHINKHLGKRPYVCEVADCDKTFYCKLLLRLHRTSIHTGQSVMCEVCNKTFPSERSLYSHNLRHKNQNRYNCDHCERKFNNSNSLKRHLAIHSGIREYICQYCESSFYRKFNLDVHIRTVHDKDKSFFCGHCPKKFGYARLLRDHVGRNHVEKIEIQSVEFLAPNGIES